jgi:hypothetical protein
VRGQPRPRPAGDRSPRFLVAAADLPAAATATTAAAEPLAAATTDLPAAATALTGQEHRHAPPARRRPLAKAATTTDLPAAATATTAAAEPLAAAEPTAAASLAAAHPHSSTGHPAPHILDEPFLEFRLALS